MARSTTSREDSRFKDMSLAETAYVKIKEDILRNKFPSGEFISISDLSDSLEGMGRTPVREAVQRLHDERLLIVVPRKGIIIPEFDIKKMMDQLELRYVLEKYATLKATPKFPLERVDEVSHIQHDMADSESKTPYQLAKLNMAFHMKIIEVISNQELIQTLSRIYDHHIRIYTYFLDSKDRFFATQQEHDEIVDALKKRDVKLVETAVDKHYENTRRELLDAIMT
jgi:GntR family transcriptional regulator, rspAB operon transcriptional repressor